MGGQGFFNIRQFTGLSRFASSSHVISVEVRPTCMYCTKTVTRTHQKMRSRTRTFYDDNVHVEASAYAHRTQFLISTITI